MAIKRGAAIWKEKEQSSHLMIGVNACSFRVLVRLSLKRRHILCLVFLLARIQLEVALLSFAKQRFRLCPFSYTLQGALGTISTGYGKLIENLWNFELRTAK
jgi:hypothetical protein